MLKPLLDNLIIKPLPKQEKTTGGLIIPDSVKNPTGQAEVIAVSVEDKEPVYQVGDTVVYKEGSGTEITIEEVRHLLIERRQICAIV